jgi:hypothetical protein
MCSARACPIFGTRRFDVHRKQTFMNPQANRSEFCFVMQPLRMQGFTGSTVAPAALF